jgi:hypothetical protein
MRVTAVVLMAMMAGAGYGDLTPLRSSPPRGEGGTTTVRLKAEAEVRGEVVRVADVADVAGSEEAKARIGAVVVGPSPLPGDVRMISAGYVKLRLRRAGIGAEAAAVEGEWVKVKGATSPPGPLSLTGMGEMATAPHPPAP